MPDCEQEIIIEGKVLLGMGIPVDEVIAGLAHVTKALVIGQVSGETGRVVATCGYIFVGAELLIGTCAFEALVGAGMDAETSGEPSRCLKRLQDSSTTPIPITQ